MLKKDKIEQLFVERYKMTTITRADIETPEEE